MLSLNIKSKSYMCLDIDPNSVVHDILAIKITNVIYYGETQHSDNLTMLPSFHISLGAPEICSENSLIDKSVIRNKYIKTAGIIGDITLAPICISEKNNKKSAWIPLHPYFYSQICAESNKAIWRNNYQPYGGEEKGVPYKYLHISLANLTGNPHDSIARPEDCIIDTITT